MCRIKNRRNGTVLDFPLLDGDSDFMGDLLLSHGYEYDEDSRAFLLTDSEFLEWLGRGERFARVFDAYSMGDGTARLAAELVAGLYSGDIEGLLEELERVLRVA